MHQYMEILKRKLAMLTSVWKFQYMMTIAETIN